MGAILAEHGGSGLVCACMAAALVLGGCGKFREAVVELVGLSLGPDGVSFSEDVDTARSGSDGDGVDVGVELLGEIFVGVLVFPDSHDDFGESSSCEARFRSVWEGAPSHLLAVVVECVVVGWFDLSFMCE